METPTEQLIEQLGKTIEGLQQDKEQIAKEAWELKEAYDTLRDRFDKYKASREHQEKAFEHKMNAKFDTLRAERDELVKVVEWLLELYDTNSGNNPDAWLAMLDTARATLTHTKGETTTKGGEDGIQ